MPKGKHISYIIINAVVFIILEVAALGMLSHSGTVQNFWITRGIHAMQSWLWGGTESVRYYFSLKSQNDRLAEENFRLAQTVRYYRMITGKDYATDISTSADTVGDYRYIHATITKLGNNSQHNYMIIGKGSEDGVAPKSGIITGQGAIGIVDAVGKHYSYALSFRNSGISISARIGREGPVGSLRWDGRTSHGAVLSEIPHHIRIEPGDTVYTSGYSSIFPPDIPLGITGEYRIVNGATYEIRISLLEDFSKLRYVTIVNNIARQELEELEER